MNANVSLGELQALVVKAARGAGRGFGLADEAGYAARWLAERGFDGAGALAALLQATDGLAPAAMGVDPDSLRPVGAEICPLVLGTYLADTAMLPEGPVGPVRMPVVLAPFAAQFRGGVRLEYGAAPLGLAGDAAFGGAEIGPPTGQVRLTGGTAAGPRLPQLTRAQMSSDAQAILERLAARTYAPATEASRAKGAGAGLTDGD